MPNTLAHLGVQTLLGRAVQPQADLKWILLGCSIPDVSWILQVIGRQVPGIDLIDLRLYALVQSSLLFCLIVSAALAMLSHKPLRTFATLTIAVLLHFALDATQTKWGNGVLLGLPFDWSLVNVNLYWPEDWPSYALTAVGLISMLIWWRQGVAPTGLRRPSPQSMLASIALIGLWMLGPVAFMGEAEAGNLHNTAVLRPDAARIGQPFTVDRNTATVLPDGTVHLRSWTGEIFTLTGIVPAQDALISLKGRFTGSSQIAVTDLRLHQDGPREWFSYTGLLMILSWWSLSLFRGLRR